VNGWRTALRMAWRETRRAKGRSALVLVMIALPVAALSFGAVVYKTFTLTPGEQANRLMGTAQAAAIWPYDGPIHQDPISTTFDSDIFVPRADTQYPEPSLQRLIALLPTGTRAIPDQLGRLTVHTATGVGTLRARMLDYTDPLAHGIYRQLSGRAPRSADEVALTPEAVSRTGARVGDTVRLADGSRTFRVVGVVEDPSDLKATTIVLPSGALPGAALSTDRHDLRYLLATPGSLTWTQVKQLNEHGIVAVSRYVLAHPPSQNDVQLRRQRDDGGTALGVGLAAGVAVLEIVLLAGPAFAVSAHRRRRELALIAAAGGKPAHLRRIVLADGVVLGVLAAAIGVVVGVITAAATRPLIENTNHMRSGSFRLFPAALAALAGLAVLTGTLAALVPAWSAARQDVVTALAGRRGITRSRRRWLVVGVALGVAGAGVTGAGAWQMSWGMIVAGLVVVEFGLVLCTPAIVGLVARLGRFAPVAPRIALRDTSRNRTAAAPAISAVMAAVVGTLVIAVVGVASSQRAVDESSRASGRPGLITLFQSDKFATGTALPPETVAVLRSTMPVDQVYEVDMPSCDPGLCLVTAFPVRECPYTQHRLHRDPTAAEQRAARQDSRCAGIRDRYEYFGSIGFQEPATMIIDPAAVAAVANIPAADAERAAAALRAGSVVVSDGSYLDGGRVTLTLIEAGPERQQRTERTLTAPGFALPHQPPTPITLLTKETAKSLGLAANPFITVATTTRMPTVAERDRAQAALGDQFPMNVTEPPATNTTALLILAILAGVITLTAAAAATGLAAADGRADLATLAAVGASPRVRRVLSLCQSGVIAGLGSLLGAVAGLGAAVAVLLALNRRFADVWPAPTPYPILVPWLNVGVALVVVPLIAMLGAGLLTRSRLPIERRL
jgi:putative ABC transport system permease protein